MGKPAKTAQTDWLVAAVQRMFKPIARLLVGRVSCTVAIDLLKEAYIAEATRQLIEEEGRRRATKSALALKTGLDTRVIASLEKKPRSEFLTDADLAPEAAVLHAWSTDKAFIDGKSGEPRVLHVYGRRGTFQNLIMRHAGRNVTCPTVLNSLTAGGNVEIITDDQVRLLDPHYVPTSDAQRSAIEEASLAFERLGHSVVHSYNDSAGKEPWPQQHSLAGKLSTASLDKLRGQLDALLAAQSEAVSAALADASGDEGDRTAGVHSYYWEE